MLGLGVMKRATRLRAIAPLVLVIGLSAPGFAKPALPPEALEEQAGSAVAVESSEVVPETGLLVLFGAGLVGLATLARRRFRGSPRKPEPERTETAAEQQRRRPAA